MFTERLKALSDMVKSLPSSLHLLKKGILLHLFSIPFFPIFILAFSLPYRLLGLRDGNKLGFWRHVIGQGEKWQILKANTTGSPAPSLSLSHSGPVAGSTVIGSEDINARGRYVRIGDSILLQTFKSDHYLSLQETTASSLSQHSIPLSISLSQNNSSSSSSSLSLCEPKLIYRERTGLGAEIWQIEMFGAVPLPAWCQNRPYLR